MFILLLDDPELYLCKNCIVPLGFLPWEIQVAFPGESQLQRPNLRIMLGVLVYNNPPNSDMDYRIFNVGRDINACNCTWGCKDTCKRICTESWLWEKNPLPHQGMKPASAACRPNALPTELHHSSHSINSDAKEVLLFLGCKSELLGHSHVGSLSPMKSKQKDWLTTN